MLVSVEERKNIWTLSRHVIYDKYDEDRYGEDALEGRVKHEMSHHAR